MPTFFFFSSRRRHTRWNCDWSSDVCSSDLSDDMNRPAMQSRRRRWLSRQRPTIWPVTVGRRANVVRRPTADCQFRSRSYAPGSLSSLLLTRTCAHTYLCIDVRYVYTTCMITFLRATCRGSWPEETRIADESEHT